MAKKLETLESPTNGAKSVIDMEQPYVVEVSVEGVAPLVFHRWNCESVEEKANAKKGSKAKKTDDVESYVVRDEHGHICVPGDYMRAALVHAAKYLQDPRSPRKSAQDLYKAGVVVLTELASLGSKDWDYLDKRRVVIQKNSITRLRPAFNKGWKATFHVQVLLPEYITQDLLNDSVQRAGRFSGFGDMRPTYGRFQIIGFKIVG